MNKNEQNRVVASPLKLLRKPAICPGASSDLPTLRPFSQELLHLWTASALQAMLLSIAARANGYLYTASAAARLRSRPDG